jgi:hypothetical protein
MHVARSSIPRGFFEDKRMAVLLSCELPFLRLDLGGTGARGEHCECYHQQEFQP